MTHHLRLKLSMHYYLRVKSPYESWFKVMYEESPDAIQLVTLAKNAKLLRQWVERHGLGCYFFGEWQTNDNYDVMVGVGPRLRHYNTQMSS